MQTTLLISLIFSFFLSLPTLAQQQCDMRNNKKLPQVNCLPTEIKLTDIVSAQLVEKGVKKISVAEKLTEMKAHCEKGKLLDKNGKEIYFYHLVGCWGNPPPDYLEILAKQREELEELKKKYTVIEMTCNPEGALIP